MDELNFENINEKVKEYAIKETKKIKYSLKEEYNESVGNLRFYVYQKKIKFVKITKTLQCTVSIEDGRNKLIVNNSCIHSTDKLIVWTKPEENGNRIAIFETKGSDNGLLKIFNKSELLYEETGFINDIIFIDDGFYIIKEKRPDKVTDKKISRTGVYLNGNYVFGNEIEPGNGLEGYTFGDKLFIVSGNNISSTIYSGNINSPSDWKIIEKLECQVKLLGYRENKTYKLLYEGSGYIASSEDKFSTDDSIEDAVMVKEGL
ncbi:hypothetical protein [Ferroplasma sp.]|uniref:hypothetical protein n=1 Tax=Ferroplasma sp. TaxID=2591003 RepID=UPI00307FB924